ncbi:hypothetical protein Poly51_29340 [Rubripirellula tenax]|uniref:Uncharacterized protein n=1 Tax=Rubripirellula tenax TaxID=2528015 RepID=A0A5C6F5M7_9BACT|nr:hypothetical protein Poly51_29340 [Rubripirellula tenax]
MHANLHVTVHDQIMAKLGWMYQLCRIDDVPAQAFSRFSAQSLAPKPKSDLVAMGSAAVAFRVT